ncbi:MAG: hypothetical protein NDI60_06495 [Elusimicrobiales bacterium]|nr:hypothetical protein [Elusimicrobiales bacterium]
MENKKKQELKLAQTVSLRHDLRLFSLLARPEAEFLAAAAELEADPLFARLLAPGPGGGAPVVRRRFAGASYAFTLACGDGALASAAERCCAGEWLADRPAMLALAKRAGQENFSRYFLADAVFDAAAAARACGLSAAQAAALKAFTDAFILAHERVQPAQLPRQLLRCAALVEAEGGRLTAAYTHPAYLRGAYVINGEELARLLRGGTLSRAEAARVRRLASAAQRVSWRKAGFHRALAALLEEQKDFFLGRGPLKPFSQRALAARVALDPATVSRLVSARTVRAPWGEEVRLKDLFRPKSAFVIDRIREVLGGAAAKRTDAEVAASLKSAYGIKISRRSVNLYRRKAGL